MTALIGVAIVVGLCLWILGDMWLMKRRKFSAPAPKNPSEIKARQVKQVRYFMVGFGMAIYAMAYNEWISPHHPPFSGKLSSIYWTIYQTFGPQGISVFWMMVATGFVLIGLLMKPHKLAPNSPLHTDASRQ